MERLNWKESGDGVTFQVKVVPRAKRDEIVGVEGGALKVRLNAPPVEGKANVALVKFLAEKLAKRRGDVEIVRGETGRHKTILVRGVKGTEIEELAP